LVDPERQWFLEVVPEDHFVRRLAEAIAFEEFRPFLEAAYRGFGRPPLACLFMLKLELLARQYRLSDREVIAVARFNIAYRLFLGIRLKSPLPHHTLLTYFRPWADELSAPTDGVHAAAAGEKLQAALALAHKVLADRDDPKAGDKVISAQDADARCGKHGDYYDGYLSGKPSL